MTTPTPRIKALEVALGSPYRAPAPPSRSVAVPGTSGMLYSWW
ncbi:hypothetical protein HanIR_Chr07g0337201 [Helianthus annuus]|nr:hypothetical protein HanIR_Chr07g0337201 [Helianthus annuus]